MKGMKASSGMLCVAVLAMLAGCGGRQAAPAGMAADSLETAVADDDWNRWLPQDTSEVRMCQSEDGRVRFYSWDTHQGGTRPDYAALCVLRGGDGRWHVADSSGARGLALFVHRVHSVPAGGRTYYIVEQSHKASSAQGYSVATAYEVVCDTLQEVRLFARADGACTESVGVEYNIPDWYFATNGEGWDWLFAYEASERALHVPCVGDDGRITDRYRVYRFDGEKFRDTGERPHPGLSDSLGTYSRLLRFVRTSDVMARVDALGDGTLRYAAWNLPATMADVPALVLYGGACDEEAETYTFRNGSYVYTVGEGVTEETDEGYTRMRRYLVVRYGERELYRQEILVGE